MERKTKRITFNLNKFSIPVYGRGDVKNDEDVAGHERINKFLEERLQLAQEKIDFKRWGLERSSKQERGGNDEEPKKRKRKKVCSEPTIKEQKKPCKYKLLEPYEPKECLTLQSLVKSFYRFT